MKVAELIEILRNAETIQDIDRYRDDNTDFIPITKLMIGYDQRNRAHQYNLWEHSLHTVVNLPKNIDDDMVYLAALLHDIGKPDCQSIDYYEGKVNMHYYGHPERSEQMVHDFVIPQLHLTDNDTRRLLYYVRYHDDHVSLRMKHLRRHLRMGASLEEFQTLMHLQVADAKAHIIFPMIQERIDVCEQLAGEYSRRLYEDILKGK